MQQPSWFRHLTLCAVVAGLLALLAVGCSLFSDKGATAPHGDMVNLVYYTIGEPDPDLELVNAKINEVLAKKIGITITYIKVGWQEYENRLNAMVSAGTPFDIAYAPEFTTYVKRGAWLRLDDYLSNTGKDMYDVIDPIFWEGVRMDDGGIYGVPTNKELAVRQQWMYPEELVRKYNIDITKYNTLESLEPLLQMIQQKEPEYLPMELDKDSHNFFALYGYECVMAVSADTKYPVECIKFLNLLNTDPEVRNLFNYGIEGVHYTIDKNGQVVLIPRKDADGNPIPDALPGYTGVTYTQGNWFILKTRGGDDPEPLNKWEEFRASNARAVKSSTFGFTPDLSMMPIQIQNIKMVWQKYYPSLMTGSVDVDTELPKFNEELKQAGLDEVRAEIQKQLDAWSASKQQ